MVTKISKLLQGKLNEEKEDAVCIPTSIWRFGLIQVEVVSPGTGKNTQF